jgi:hypothetical protein
MILNEQFEKDTIGKLLIESSIKVNVNDREKLLRVISGKMKSFITESYNINDDISVLNIGENIISIDFSENFHEIAEFIIESCDDFGYKTITNVYDDKINIRIVK